MGSAVGKDFFRCAGNDKFMQYLAPKMAAIFDLTPEFAIGKGAGAALTKLYIGLGVEFAFAPKPPGLFGALANFLTTLKHYGFKPHLGQHQRCENAAGAKADDYRALLVSLGKLGQWFSDKLIVGVGTGAYSRQGWSSFQYAVFSLLGEHYIKLIDKHYATALAGIMAAFKNTKADQVCGIDAQGTEDFPLQVIVAVV